MKVTSMQPVYAADGPFTSVCLDVSRTDAAAAHEIELRWRSLREDLAAAGCDAATLELIGGRLQELTGYGGALARMLVCSGRDSIVLDEVHPLPDWPSEASFAPVPHLMAVVRARTAQTPYVLVKVDHAGADIVAVEGAGLTTETLHSEGGHDVLHKVPGGGWSQRRYQSRVEDSWDRNADHVAADLDRVVARHRPELVIVVGEEYSRAAVRKASSGRVMERLVDLEHGSRAEGASDEALHAEIAAVLVRHRAEQAHEALGQFQERAGRDEAVAGGLGRVVEALREGAVETLLLSDDPSSTFRLYGGEEPLQIGSTEAEVTALGATRVSEDRADELILRALVAQDADLQLVRDPEKTLPDGIGALLRFDIRPTGGGPAH